MLVNSFKLDSDFNWQWTDYKPYRNIFIYSILANNNLKYHWSMKLYRQEQIELNANKMFRKFLNEY
jgi:hypothetical protein